MKEGLLRYAHIAHVQFSFFFSFFFDEIEHYRIKPCRAGIIFLFFSSLSCFLFFGYIYIRYIYTHFSHKTIVRTPSPCFIVRVPHQKARGKKRKNSLDPPHPTYLLHRPCATFVSNTNKTKRGATVSGLMTGLTPYPSSSFSSSSSSSITTP